MIKEFEFYYGAALARLIHSNTPLSVQLYPTPSNSSYVINGEVGLFLKYCSKRMTPWSFTFSKEHQKEIDSMKHTLKGVIIGLVCHDDGVVGLTYSELRMVLDEVHDDVEGISISRKPRHQYSVKGKDGHIHYKISEGDFLKKILEASSGL